MAEPYWQLLQRPEWKAKRREILEKTGHQCFECGREQEEHILPLEVHHLYYEKGKMPWEYPDRALRVLCRGCHAKMQKAVDELRRVIGTLILEELYNARAFIEGGQMITGGLEWVTLCNHAEKIAFSKGFKIDPRSLLREPEETWLGDMMFLKDELFAIKDANKPKRQDPSYV